MSAEHAPVSLVVNADEFGLTEEVSRGILTAHREGIVTSTSILGNCADLGAVRAALADAPSLGVGLQLCLLRGAPIAAPAAGASLAGPDGRLPDQARQVFSDWIRGKLRVEEIEREFDAQIARALAAGLTLDHLDTQHHIGVLPPVGIALERVAHRHGIAGIRSTVEEPTLTWVTELPRGAVAALLGGLAWVTRRQMGTLRHGPQAWGHVESGQLDEVRILEILGRLGPGSHELICHPGEVDDPGAGFGLLPSVRLRRSRELAALTSPVVREALIGRGIRLCRWSDLV